MDEGWIGSWVARPGRTRAHLVQSIVADRAVTRCGRQLHEKTGRGNLALVDTEARELGCKVCLA